MRHKRIIVICQAAVVCAVWACGFVVLQPASAQVPQPTQVEKLLKVKKPKKADVDAMSPAASPQTAAPTAAQTATQEMKHKAPAPVKNASSAEIDSAKAAGKVWVNTDTGVYHKGGRWFGATKQGKFMSEQDAMKAGYHAAKNEK